MIKEMIFLQFYGGGTFGNLLNELRQVGVFDYVLPFLIVFALVFGIFERIQVFSGNRSVNAIIAFSVGLISLQFNLVPLFFAEIFPRFGVGIAVLLVVLILLGLFMDPGSNAMNALMLGIGAIIAIVILLQVAEAFSFFGGSFPSFWINDNFATIITVIVTIGLIGWVFASQYQRPAPTPGNSPWQRGLGGNP